VSSQPARVEASIIVGFRIKENQVRKKKKRPFPASKKKKWRRWSGGRPSLKWGGEEGEGRMSLTRDTEGHSRLRRRDNTNSNRHRC